jgi:AcrR family transcriptional regulator
MYRMVHFSAMAPGDARRRLLEASIEYVANNGLTDLSLRRLAAELGTSHRMLIHHFGSKEGLWVAIIREVEQRQLAAIGDVVPGSAASFADAMRAWWRHISDPALWPNERLFFEVYGQALHRNGPAAELLDGVVDTWVEPIAEAGVAMGLAPDTARASARLGIAVTRGLLLDLLATNDREAVDAAMEHWIALNEAYLAQLAAAPAR